MATPIFGTSTVSLEAAQAWARSRGAHQRFIDVAQWFWQHAPVYGIPPEIPYGLASWETNWGKYTGVVPWTHHNWGGIKTKTGWSDTDPEHHQKFANDEDGAVAVIQHLYRYGGKTALPTGETLIDPRYGLVSKFTDTVEGLGGAWAPSPTYGKNVAGRVADLVDFANNQTWEAPMGDTPKVALAAGHRNSSGGDAIEKEQTAQLTPLLAAALRRYGMDVRVITPDEGRGMYPGGLDAVASQVRADDDLFIEVHTEGNDAGDAGRGVFVVYPDWDDDVDADARDTLGPSIAKRVSSASGMPVRGKGVMSEKDTSVGRDGYRLGVFRVTAPLRANTTRMIVEYGSHSSPADMARWRTPGVVQAMADATADAVARFFEVDTATPVTPVQPAPVPDPNALYIPQTDKLIVNQGVYKMLDAWREFGGLEGCGWPLDGMTGDGRDDGGVEQLFENVLIEIDSQGNARRGGLGQRYERALKRLQELEAA
jgi:N-acetylmuramoyl-L-alanine amidase